MRGFDAGKRALFETSATALYERVVNEGSIAQDEPSIARGGADHDAHTLLVEVGLLQKVDGRWLPVDPATVQSQIVAPLGQEGADLINESANWAKAFSGLAQTWRRSPNAITGPFTELHGDQRTSFIAALVADAEAELLTAQPQAGRSGRGLAAAAQRDIEALDRGVRLRTLYQHSARRSRITAEYVSQVSRHGAEVRTLDEFFNRLIVIDRRVAVIPSQEGTQVAVVVREPSVIAYLVDVFERSWERGRAFIDHETSLVRDIAEEQRAMTIRMLVEGHPDQASAKRLGISPRTYASYVAELKNEFEVDTRFQLGYTMGRQGVSGRETGPSRPEAGPPQE